MCFGSTFVLRWGRVGRSGSGKKDVFRVLYGLALDPNGLVMNSFDFERNIWIPRLHQNLNDWEIDELGRLLSVVDSIRPNPRMVDTWVWALNRKGVFSSKSLYFELIGDRSIDFPHKIICFHDIPSKVVFFL